MFIQPFNWREMNRLRREVDRLFENTIPRARSLRAGSFPAINVWAKDSEGLVVTAELPGVESGAVDITVTADTLTITGERQPEETHESARFHRQERAFGEFSRTIQLPYAVNRESVEATMENGVLRVNLPRAEAEKPKQIRIQAG